MRHKKVLKADPPAAANDNSPTATPSPLSIKYDVAATINLIEQMLARTMGPDTGVSPAQLCDLMEMFLTLLHLRKVTPDYWMEVSTLATRGITLAQRIQAEANLSRVPDLPEAATKLINDAIDLSVKEINGVRKDILERLTLLTKMAPVGAPIH